MKILSEAHMDFKVIIKKYDMTFQKFLAQNIDINKMTSMIYGVNRNGKRDIGYVSPKHSRIKPNSK